MFGFAQITSSYVRLCLWTVLVVSVNIEQVITHAKLTIREWNYAAVVNKQRSSIIFSRFSVELYLLLFGEHCRGYKVVSITVLKAAKENLTLRYYFLYTRIKFAQDIINFEKTKFKSRTMLLEDGRDCCCVSFLLLNLKASSFPTGEIEGKGDDTV